MLLVYKLPHFAIYSYVIFVCLIIEYIVNLISICFIPGLVSGLIEVNRLLSIDLYDTTMDYQDVRISDELIKSQLMWPNMSLDQTDSSEDKEKYVNPKVHVSNLYR